jgi:quercetin dioxygenase-like cupin family protein
MSAEYQRLIMALAVAGSQCGRGNHPTTARSKNMTQTHATTTTSGTRRRIAATITVLGGCLAVFAAHAATSATIGSGTLPYSAQVGGPAIVTMRTLTLVPGEVLGWHNHEGIGAYTIVVSGTLTVEDGCGGDTTYSQGQAFLESANRVHRGKNLTSANVVTAQTFLMPVGTPISDAHTERMCGVPLTVAECENDGWRAFNFPETFINQGACVAYVKNTP